MQRYEDLEAIVLPAIMDGGYDLVRLGFYSEGGRKILQIMVERQDGAPIELADCERLSRELSALLDVADPIKDRYSLEISSAGLDRPLVKREDFTRFKDQPAKVETSAPINAMKRFKGIIHGLSDHDEVMMTLDDGKGDILLPYSLISKAKLVITDEMLNPKM